MELESWLRENPLAAPQGIKAHAAELQRLKALGYTQDQMRVWLATQGLKVSRQAISKFFLHSRATKPQPESTTAQPQRTSAATGEQQACKPSKNPSAAPPNAPGERTLKERAQAVGDRYLKQTLSPLASQLLNTTRKT